MCVYVYILTHVWNIQKVKHMEVRGQCRFVVLIFWDKVSDGTWMELMTQTDWLAIDPHGDAAPVSNAPALWLQVGAATLAFVWVLGTWIQAPC